jgi:hypothetical protein
LNLTVEGRGPLFALVVFVGEETERDAEKFEELLEVDEAVLDLINNLVNIITNETQESVENVLGNEMAVDNQLGKDVFSVVLVDLDVLDLFQRVHDLAVKNSVVRALHDFLHVLDNTERFSDLLGRVLRLLASGRVVGLQFDVLNHFLETMKGAA